MGEILNWDEESAGYIRGRGDRYPGGRGIEPEWAQQVMHDVDLVAFEPDPNSRMGWILDRLNQEKTASSTSAKAACGALLGGAAGPWAA